MSSLSLAARLRPAIRAVVGLESEYRLRRALYRLIPADNAHPERHFLHCTAWRSASQWVRMVLSDPRLYRYHGHLPYAAHNLPPPDARGAMATSLYMPYGSAKALLDRAPGRAIFVVRDPRDLLVSWYLSNRYLHDPVDVVVSRRAEMEGLSDEDGIARSVETFTRTAMLLWSWAREARDDPRVRIVRFEDITGAGKIAAWRGIFEHYGIAVPDDEIARLMRYYDQANLRGARKSYRDPATRGWQNTLTGANRDKFMQMHGKLVEAFGYS